MILKGIQVIEICGESCANCLSLMPLLHRILKERNDVELLHIEVSQEHKDFIEKYQIDRVPTILILKDGLEIARTRGYQPEEILEIWLDDKISKAKCKEEN